MSLAPLLDAGLAVRWHVASALLALLLGPVALMPRSRDRWHCAAGALWIAAMSSTAACSFLIADRAGLFSPLHLLELFLLWGRREASPTSGPGGLPRGGAPWVTPMPWLSCRRRSRSCWAGGRARPSPPTRPRCGSPSRPAQGRCSPSRSGSTGPGAPLARLGPRRRSWSR